MRFIVIHVKVYVLSNNSYSRVYSQNMYNMSKAGTQKPLRNHCILKKISTFYFSNENVCNNHAPSLLIKSIKLTTIVIKGLVQKPFLKN